MVSEVFYGNFIGEPENTFEIYFDPNKDYKEILRIHGDGKVTVRGKTYENMSEMAKDVFGVCRWNLGWATVKPGCQERYIAHSEFIYCPYCGREIEEVKP